MHCMNVMSPRQIPLHTLMSLANKYSCALVSNFFVHLPIYGVFLYVAQDHSAVRGCAVCQAEGWSSLLCWRPQGQSVCHQHVMCVSACYLPKCCFIHISNGQSIFWDDINFHVWHILQGYRSMLGKSLTADHSSHSFTKVSLEPYAYMPAGDLDLKSGWPWPKIKVKQGKEQFCWHGQDHAQNAFFRFFFFFIIIFWGVVDTMWLRTVIS